jgi:hypothetical protein
MAGGKLGRVPKDEASAAITTFPSDQRFYTVIGEDDVLLGRGTGPNEFSGNIRYRRLVSQAITSVHPRDLASKKLALARKVVDDVAENGGRFVRKLPKSEVAALYESLSTGSAEKAELASHVAQKTAVYINVPREVAIEKTKQSFRHQTRVKKKPPEATAPTHNVPPDSPSMKKRRTSGWSSVMAEDNATAETSSSGATFKSTAQQQQRIQASQLTLSVGDAPLSRNVLVAGRGEGMLGNAAAAASAASSTSTVQQSSLTPSAIQAFLLRYAPSLSQTVDPPPLSSLSSAIAALQQHHQINYFPPLQPLSLLNQLAAALVTCNVPSTAATDTTTSSSNILHPQAALAHQLARQQQQQYTLAALLASTQRPTAASSSVIGSNNSESIIASLIAAAAARHPSASLNEQQGYPHPHLNQHIDTTGLLALLQGATAATHITHTQPSSFPTRHPDLALEQANSNTMAEDRQALSNDNNGEEKSGELTASSKKKAKRDRT